MRKIAQLAAKDLRHVWPLLAAVLPLMFLFSTNDVQRLILHKTVLAATAWQALFLATPLAIWSLVATLIHGEPLVGDRQYWLTRPFTWRHLAAAKLLVIAICINAPLFLFQAIALGVSQISPLTYLPDLLWRQVFFSAFFLLPAAALAAVTRTQGQFAVSILLAVTPFAALAWGQWNTPVWTEVTALAAFVVAGTVATLLLQYGWRRAALSRSLIAVTILSCLALVLFHWTTIYEPLSASRELRLSLDPTPRPKPEQSQYNRVRAIDLPLVAEGMPADVEPAISSYWITVGRTESPDSRAWVGAVSLHGWNGNRGFLQVVLGPESYRRLGDHPVTVKGHIYFALMKRSGIRDTKPDTVWIDGFGVCSRSRALCLSPQPHAALSLVAMDRPLQPDQFGRFVPVSDTFAPFPYSPSFYPLESYHYEPELGRLLVERPAGLFRADIKFEGVPQ